MVTTTTSFPCNACDMVFTDSAMQRSHMRESWHVYNIKRRMEELPPVSADEYLQTVSTSVMTNKPKPRSTEKASVPTHSRDEVTEESREPEYQPTQCLFCMRHLDSLELNLDHMHSVHGLYLPDIDHLASLDSMLGYLHTIITQYHECLLCGMVKPSAKGVRQHMLDKGHCMINVEREPELLEFWDFSDESGDEGTTARSQKVTDLSADEHILPSGKIIGSKNKAREIRLSARRFALMAKVPSTDLVVKDSEDKSNTIPTSESTANSRDSAQDRALTTRDAMGLVGVSDQQIRSLVTVERKMQRQQAIVHASRSWAGELGGQHQKFSKQKMWLRDG